MTAPDHILLLAGTFEARQLAERLSSTFPGLHLTVSFAGVVRDLPDLGVPTRIGGFGGTAGLAKFLEDESVTLVIDATHPFAAQMSRNAFEACSNCRLPLLRLERPAWKPLEEDRWEPVVSIEDAVSALPSASRAFLAVGRKEISRFYPRSDIFGVARMIEPPRQPLPPQWELVLARPSSSAQEEMSLLRTRGITHLVAKNSGGERSYAKIEAARRLGLPVIMIDRPKLPRTKTSTTVADTVEKIRIVLASNRS